MLPQPSVIANFWVWDAEVFPNLFLVGFQQIGGETRQFWITAELNETVELWEFWRELADQSAFACGFNNHEYDDHILHAVLMGMEQNEELFNLSRCLIEDSTFKCSPFGDRNHAHPIVLDLRRITGDQAGSLKEIGVKLDHEKLQKLPFPYDLPLDPRQIGVIASYNRNDLDITAKLLQNLAAAIEARIDLSAEYGDLLAARDSRIGETILSSKMTPTRRMETEWTGLGSAIISDKIRFSDPVLVAQHTRMLSWPLTYRVELVEENGEQKKKLIAPHHGDEIKFAGVTYRLGMGGLHSVDEPGIFEANDGFELLDIDVSSYYPSLITTLGLSPRHINTNQFQYAYGKLIEQRLAAKAGGQSALAAGLKLAINSVFGKFSSPYSSLLFDPMLSAAVTLNGQLILLMLVETVGEVDGVEILSANTDGIIIKAPRNCADVHAAVDQIGREFDLSFEYTPYRKYVRRDINNFMAVGPDGKRKARGAYHYDQQDVRKKATNRIVIDAVQNHFFDGTPVAETIRRCRDIRKFVDYFKLTAEWAAEDEHGRVIGKINRWYISASGVKLLKRKGDKLIKFAEGAAIVTDLPTSLPEDVCYDHYIAEAVKLIEPIENPEMRVSSTIPLADLSDSQQEMLRRNRDSTDIEPAHWAAMDLAAFTADYVAEYKGNKYDSMLAVLVRLWVAGQGGLTKGDLAQLAAEVDESVGYFTRREKKRALDSLIEWIVRDISPFPVPWTIEQVAEQALEWAQTKVERDRRKTRLQHKSVFDSTLVTSKALNDYLKTRELRKFAASIAAKAVANAYPFDAAQLIAILQELINLTRTLDYGRSEVTV